MKSRDGTDMLEARAIARINEAVSHANHAVSELENNGVEVDVAIEDATKARDRLNSALADLRLIRKVLLH